MEQQQLRQPTVQLQLTESPELEPLWRHADGTQTPETPANNANCLQSGEQRSGSGNTFGELLAQGMKRVNSVNNLAIPGMGSGNGGGGGANSSSSSSAVGGSCNTGGSQFTRSLPPSPQHTPR